jgi:hypothetical protein
MSDNLPACSAKYQYSSKKVKVFVFSKLSVLKIRGKTSYEIELNIINKTNKLFTILAIHI